MDEGCSPQPGGRRTAAIGRSEPADELTGRPSAAVRIVLPTDRAARLGGIGLMFVALLCFACLDTTAKVLNGSMDTIQVVWARYTFAFLVSVGISGPLDLPKQLVTRRPGLQIVRSMLLLLSTGANFYALRFLQLDQTIAIGFSSPFIVAIIAGPILGEWVGPRRMIAIMVGFLGVLVVTRPGFGGLHWAFLLSILSAAAYAVYNVLTRILASYDSTNTTLLYSSLIGVIALTPAMPFVWTWPAQGTGWLLMFAVGAFGAVGHWFHIRAHRRAPAAILAPFIYAEIIAMVALGWLVFGDVPSAWTLAGAAIVIASGLYLLYREQTRQVAPSADAMD